MLDWNDANQDDAEDDFLAASSETGEAPAPAACPLNPDGLEGCEACQVTNNGRW